MTLLPDRIIKLMKLSPWPFLVVGFPMFMFWHQFLPEYRATLFGLSIFMLTLAASIGFEGGEK